MAAANRIADAAAAAMAAVFEHGGVFIAEAPVARGVDSPFAIEGRESHIGVFHHPSLKTLRSSTASSIIHFDQCRTREDPTKTPQKTTSLLASPNVAASVQRLFGPLSSATTHLTRTSR